MTDSNHTTLKKKQRSKEPASPKHGAPHHLMRRRDVASCPCPECSVFFLTLLTPTLPATPRCGCLLRTSDLAKLHAKMALQRLTYAVLTLPSKICGDSCAPVSAMALRKSSVSWDQRPPTSAAKNTKRALPLSPETGCLPHRSWWLRSVVPCRRHARVTPRWCPPPTVPRARGTTHQR